MTLYRSIEDDADKEKGRKLTLLFQEASNLRLSDRYGDEVQPTQGPGDKERSIPGVCGTCTHSMITRRPFGSAVVYCEAMRRTVPSDLEWCSSHDRPRAGMGLREMAERAYLIDPRTGSAGLYL